MATRKTAAGVSEALTVGNFEVEALTDRQAELVEAIRAFGASQGTRISLRAFCAETGTFHYEIVRLFGGWGDACRLAGVDTAARIVKEPEELLAGLHGLFAKRGVLGVAQIDALRKPDRLPASTGCYDRHFGGWAGTLKALRDWLDQAGIQADYLERLDDRLAQLDARAGRTRVTRPRIPAQPDEALDGRRLGQPVSDRTFAYAPTNELGVAMWFGAVAKQLGFQILSVHPNFPDFTAVRRGPDGYWRTVDGELKFVSSGYREDYASGKIADVLVVWRHDWTECPIPVVELSSLDVPGS